jgi:peroxiredoxin
MMKQNEHNSPAERGTLRIGGALRPLQLPLAGGSSITIGKASESGFTVLMFYRGYHCPFCRKQLNEMERLASEFREKGVSLIAISCDTHERAEKTREEWRIHNIPIAYGLDPEEGRKWGLFVSSAIKESEPERFCEPGIFLMRSDGTLYASSIQSMPFTRPGGEELLKALEMILEKNYPSRGEA